MITREQLDHLCLLIALELPEEEKERLLPELSSILDFVGQLSNCPVDDAYEDDHVVLWSMTQLPPQSWRTQEFLSNIRHHIKNNMPELQASTVK